ncbi:MAG TPA: fasciclin domain-containing protein [Brevundimonas sp.]|nr:fasciclin domain-containing protein [Brevundimonas sp.]
MIRISTAAALAAVSLAACNPAPEAEADGGTAAPSSRTLAAELRSVDQLNTLEGILGNSGLERVLDGVGPYTVFAPVDAAFTGASAFDFRDDAEKAQAAALLRSHMVPGSVTRADVSAALGRAQDGKVEMRTLDNGLITFTREGETIVATLEDGGRGVLTGEEVVASNGVVQPIDGVLLKAPAA